MPIQEDTRLAPNNGAPLIELLDVCVPQAFVDSHEGANHALAAATHATAILTELHLALASREMSIFFEAHPGIQSMGSIHSMDSDDEGHDHTTITKKTLFIDGTEIPNYNYRDDDEPDLPLGALREDLHYAAEAFLNSLAASLPLARNSIEDALHTRTSAADLPGKAFRARQEAFAISRQTGPGSAANPNTRL